MDSSCRRFWFYLSFGEAFIDQAAPLYQKPLGQSGYQYTPQYASTKTSQIKSRPRNDIPPFTKIKASAVTLAKDSYPYWTIVSLKDDRLGNIFNRNTLIIRYNCMNNVRQIIDNHNKRVLKLCNNSNTTVIDNNNTYNCRQKDACPLNGSDHWDRAHP